MEMVSAPLHVGNDAVEVGDAYKLGVGGQYRHIGYLKNLSFLFRGAKLIVFLEPVNKHLAVFLVGINKTGVP